MIEAILQPLHPSCSFLHPQEPRTQLGLCQSAAKLLCDVSQASVTCAVSSQQPCKPAFFLNLRFTLIASGTGFIPSYLH